MAVDKFFTGFESGERFALGGFNNMVFVDDGNARTGEFHLEAYIGTAAASTGRCVAITPTAGIGINNEYATGKARVFFKIKALPSQNGVTVMGYCTLGTPGSGGMMYMKSDGTFAVAGGSTIGTYSTAQLVIDTWYRADLTLTITDPSVAFPAFADATSSLSVYTEAGVLIETVTAFGSGVIASNSNFPAPSLGHHDAVVSTYWMMFDDWVSIIEDNRTPTLPTATRITRVDVTGVDENVDGGAPGNTNWQNSYLTVTEVPFEATVVDEMTNTSIGSYIKFTHETAAVLGIDGAVAAKFYVMLKTSAGTEESLYINDDELDLNGVPAAYATTTSQVYYKWVSISNDEFDSMVFGVGNKSGNTVALGQIYLEVLHAGTQIPSKYTGATSWKHKVISYVGTGAHQTITGVGFRPQIILTERYTAGAALTGMFKSAMQGGTKSRLSSSSTDNPIGVMRMTDDGFTLGPSTNANAVGITYVALCIQDNGMGTDCKLMRYGAYLAPSSALDNRDIVVKANWSPDFIMVQGATILAYRELYTPAPPDETTLLSATASAGANYIQAFNSDGFEVGTLLNNAIVYHYFAIKDVGGLSSYFDFGRFTAAGASHTVTGLAFQPTFAFAKRLLVAVDAQWRSDLVHSALASTIWNGVTSNNTGITSFTADGLTFGSTLSNLNDVTEWVAMVTQGEINFLPVTVNAGPNDSVNAFLTYTLQGSGASGTYPCGSLTPTYIWTKVSGPGSASFVDDTDPVSDVDFDASGIYVLRLTATDGFFTATDDVTITVNNDTPIANAGTDQDIRRSPLGTTVTATMAATAGDDGLPIPPALLTYLWTKVSGPGTVTFDDNTSLTTDVTFEAAGVFVLMLSVYDGEKTGTDTVTINVYEACAVPGADPTFNC